MINSFPTGTLSKGTFQYWTPCILKNFHFSSGVYYEPECGNGPDDLDHAVLLVGYGEINGEKYWLIKNSWSTYWGNDGYVLMSQKNNNCGVATAPTFVIPK